MDKPDSSMLNLYTPEFKDIEKISVSTILDEPAYNKAEEQRAAEERYFKGIRAIAEMESNRLSMTSPVMFFKHGQEAVDWMKENIPDDQPGNGTEPSPMDILTRLIADAGVCDVRIEKHVEERASVLSVTDGIPCVTNGHNIYYTITLTNKITATMPVEVPRAVKRKRSEPPLLKPQNKRKRIESTLLEKQKRVRRTNDIRKADKDIEIFRLETTWVAEADATEFLTCIVCEKEKHLSAISRCEKRRTSNGEKIYRGIQNICCACLYQANLLSKSSDMTL